MYILSLIFFIVHSINKHQNIINSIFNSPVQKVFVGHLSVHCPSTFSHYYYAPTTKSQGGILIYPCPSVRPSRYRYMVCPAISSYSFRATALIFCRMFIHIMEVCMSTGFCLSSNILKMTGSWT